MNGRSWGLLAGEDYLRLEQGLFDTPLFIQLDEQGAPRSVGITPTSVDSIRTGDDFLRQTPENWIGNRAEAENLLSTLQPLLRELAAASPDLSSDSNPFVKFLREEWSGGGQDANHQTEIESQFSGDQTVFSVETQRDYRLDLANRQGEQLRVLFNEQSPFRVEKRDSNGRLQWWSHSETDLATARQLLAPHVERYLARTDVHTAPRSATFSRFPEYSRSASGRLNEAITNIEAVVQTNPPDSNNFYLDNGTYHLRTTDSFITPGTDYASDLIITAKEERLRIRTQQFDIWVTLNEDRSFREVSVGVTKMYTVRNEVTRNPEQLQQLERLVLQLTDYYWSSALVGPRAPGAFPNTTQIPADDILRTLAEQMRRLCPDDTP